MSLWYFWCGLKWCSIVLYKLKECIFIIRKTNHLIWYISWYQLTLLLFSKLAWEEKLIFVILSPAFRNCKICLQKPFPLLFWTWKFNILNLMTFECHILGLWIQFRSFLAVLMKLQKNKQNWKIGISFQFSD